MARKELGERTERRGGGETVRWQWWHGRVQVSWKLRDVRESMGARCATAPTILDHIWYAPFCTAVMQHTEDGKTKIQEARWKSCWQFNFLYNIFAWQVTPRTHLSLYFWQNSSRPPNNSMRPFSRLQSNITTLFNFSKLYWGKFLWLVQFLSNLSATIFVIRWYHWNSVR